MTNQPGPRRSRRGAAVIVAVLVIVIASVAVIGVLASRGGPSAAAGDSPSASEPVGGTTTAAAATKPAKPVATPTVIPKGSGSPTPQPTKTAAISRPTAVAIKQELTASVAKMQAVTGKADGPGEIGGPSVRFTITISNTTGKTFRLSNTVVNAYYGGSATPAVQLRAPGGVDFPATVKDGKTATGVFVFNIPTADRAKVKVTVDTSVQNPVIAFQGAAPRG